MKVKHDEDDVADASSSLWRGAQSERALSESESKSKSKNESKSETES